MSERRFIELINLWIDGEISEAELDELEREIALRPDRKEVYEDYLRLQAASHAVCRQFGDALSRTVDLKRYEMLARESQQGWHRKVIYSAGALTAACAAVVAAVGVFPTVDWVSAEADLLKQKEGLSLVEVFEPEQAKPAGVVRGAVIFSSTEAPEQFPVFSGTGFSGMQVQFEPNGFSSDWSARFRSGNSPVVIRNGGSFEGARPANFEFIR